MPHPIHTGALAITGNRTGVAPEFGEGGLSKVAPPKAANNRYDYHVCFWGGSQPVRVHGQSSGSMLTSVVCVRVHIFASFFASVKTHTISRRSHPGVTLTLLKLVSTKNPIWPAAVAPTLTST